MTNKLVPFLTAMLLMAACHTTLAQTNDPAGGNTGTIGDLGGSGGSYTYPTFQVNAPAELSADDKKDTNKVAAYNDAKKAFDDYTAQAKAEPLAVKLADAVGHNRVAINFVWTLVTGFLVMFMQAGFALVETGLCRAKNAAHTMTMNFMIYPMGMLGFWVCGFAFMFGGLGALGGGTLGGYASLNHEWTWHLFGHDWGIIGLKGFFLSGATYDVRRLRPVPLPNGVHGHHGDHPDRRCRRTLEVLRLHDLRLLHRLGHVSGLRQLGLGRRLALPTGRQLRPGPRPRGLRRLLGRAHAGRRDRLDLRLAASARASASITRTAASIPCRRTTFLMPILGTFILAFGWFGFNPGSTLAGTDLRIAVVATNTMLASATGCMAAMLWMWWVRTKKPDPSMACNGMLAGLVAITCPCAFVSSVGACILGLVAGILVVESVFFFDRIGIDDPVGAISVHGVNGAWGCLSVGLFGDGTYGEGWNNAHWFTLPDGTYKMMDPSLAPKGAVEEGVMGLFYGGGFSQLTAEFIGVLTCFVTLSVLSLIVFYIVKAILGTHRVEPEVELEGLDVPEMGVAGYCGVVMDKQSETPTSK